VSGQPGEVVPAGLQAMCRRTGLFRGRCRKIGDEKLKTGCRFAPSDFDYFRDGVLFLEYFPSSVITWSAPARVSCFVIQPFTFAAVEFIFSSSMIFCIEV
jgi:hypothetical protein